ncbi:MAG: glycosyltransferase family 4 protein [Proteobacteria bacterium]|nr:glycosyltransferase family 4 protein [Pseudomonadota bacterium]MBU1714536.1 glycosyltransferase family 4 protein [Pseudomonadota bacterium]
MKVWLPTIKAGSGADVFVNRLAAGLRNQGLEAEITWFDRRYEFVPFLLKNILPPAGTDIIIANSWNGFAFKRAGIPLVIVELHCVLDPGFRAYKSFSQHLYHKLLIEKFETASFSKASHVVAISEYTATSVMAVFGLTDVTTIPLWVPIDKFEPEQSVPVESNIPFRLLFVGNLIRRKGADLLAPIMAQLGEDFHLRFTSGLRSAASDKCPGNMTPLGHLSEAELIREYQNCDALLFPTRFEGFGYAALEAMACGKPVVTSDNTSLPELVADGENGILCPTDDIDSFVSACRTLAGNKSRCKKMGEIGLDKARSGFSEEYNASQYASMLQSVLSGTIK